MGVNMNVYIYIHILWDSIPIGDLMGYDVEHMGYKGFHIIYIIYIKGIKRGWNGIHVTNSIG